MVAMSTSFDAFKVKVAPSYIGGARASAEIMKDDLGRRGGDLLLANAIEIIESLVNLLEIYETNPVAAQSLFNEVKARQNTTRNASKRRALCEL
jgi:hypothetical protein